ncbi:MAG: DUF3616 domain-containing protein [Myxococcota bacterium]
MENPTRIALAAVVLVAAAGALAWRASGATPSSGPVLQGLCEASTVIEDGEGFLIGDNEAEDRLFRFDANLQPAGEVRLPSEVEDIEALVPTPAGLVVVGSHSRSKKGKVRPKRHAVLALDEGRARRADLSGCEPCVAAEPRLPKEGGVSIEGAAWWRDALWLGLRSPLDGGALLLRMREDGDVLRVDEVVRADLDGRGVRELRVHGGVLWILAGPATAREEPHALYVLAEPGGAPELRVADLPSGSEGFAFVGDAAESIAAVELLVVTDGDGKPGDRCSAPATWARRSIGPS